MPVSFRRYRVLFADGELVDVIAVRDDSELRAWVFGHHYGYASGSTKGKDKRDAIAGIVDLGEEFAFTPSTEESDG